MFGGNWDDDFSVCAGDGCRVPCDQWGLCGGHGTAGRVFGIGVEEISVGIGPMLISGRWDRSVPIRRKQPLGIGLSILFVGG